MSTLADLDIIDQRLRALSRFVINNVSDASVGDARQYWDPASGNWYSSFTNYRDNSNAARLALMSVMFATTRPRDPVLFAMIVKTLQADIGNQTTGGTKPGFWDDNAGNGPGETTTGHGMLNRAIAFNCMSPYISSTLRTQWLASYKAAVDQLWATDGAGGSNTQYLVNTNFNWSFEIAMRWYANTTGSSTYLGYANYMFDFLINGTTTGIVTSRAPGWPTSYSGGNLGNPQFAGFGYQFSTLPTASDWVDGVGWGVENAGQLNYSTNPPTNTTNPDGAGYSFDGDYGTFAMYETALGYLLTGDIRYRRVFNVQFNKVKTHWNLTSANVVTKADGSAGGTIYNISTINGTGVGGAMKVTTTAAHGLANGTIVTLQAIVGTGTVASQNGQVRYIRNVTSTTFELMTTATVIVTFGGTYTSGGTIQEGGFVGAWNINAYKGARHNLQTNEPGMVLAMQTWFCGQDYSSMLIPMLTNEVAGTGSLDGNTESAYRQDSTGGGVQGTCRAGGLELSPYILLTNMVRTSYARNRPV